MKTQTVKDRPAHPNDREVAEKDMTNPQPTPKALPQPERDVRGGRIRGVLRIVRRAAL
jgi:hypothetical protein